MSVVIHLYNRIVDARDVAHAAVQAITRGRSGERYLIGGRKYSFSEICEILSDITGNPSLEKTISPGEVLVIAGLATLMHAVRGEPSPLKPGGPREISGKIQQRLKKSRGVTFRPLDERVPDAIAWSRGNRYA